MNASTTTTMEILPCQFHRSLWHPINSLSAALNYLTPLHPPGSVWICCSQLPVSWLTLQITTALAIKIRMI